MMRSHYLCLKWAWRKGSVSRKYLWLLLWWKMEVFHSLQLLTPSWKKLFTLSVVGTRTRPSGELKYVASSSFIFICLLLSSFFVHQLTNLSLIVTSVQIGWIYGSVTEDILTGFKMHARGWRSIYCIPKRPAFKGSAPINLSDRLNQVLRWALGSVEILFSRHCPLWYGYGGRLKWLERFAYVNTTIYPLTSIPLLAYCTLPAVCLLTGKFIIPQVT